MNEEFDAAKTFGDWCGLPDKEQHESGEYDTFPKFSGYEVRVLIESAFCGGAQWAHNRKTLLGYLKESAKTTMSKVPIK